MIECTLQAFDAHHAKAPFFEFKFLTSLKVHSKMHNLIPDSAVIPKKETKSPFQKSRILKQLSKIWTIASLLKSQTQFQVKSKKVMRQ